ncbi:methyl-accepting chemotaxis protein [[Clostridium] innocuum]|nr:methyl-accepting chemotaxis protein [[Clostridium] innocuum]
MKAFKNMKVTRKLLLSFLTVILLYVISISATLVGVHSITGSFNEFYNNSYQIVKESMNFRLNQYIVARNVLQIISDRDLAISAETLSETEASMEVVDDSMKNLERLYKDKEMLSELKTRYEKLVTPREKVLNLLKTEKFDEAMKIYEKEYNPQAMETRTFLRQMETTTKEEADAYYQASEESSDTMLLVLIALAGITVLFSSAIWYLISKSITRPIQELKRSAEELAAGNLHTEISYTAENELGSLAESMRMTIQALREYMSEIEKSMMLIGKGKLNYQTEVEFKGDFIALKRSLDQISVMLSESMMKISNSAEQVSGGAQQISNGAQMLSQGASEQTGSIEELAANINEISETVKRNADDTVTASDLADAVEQEIMDNSTQMEAVTMAIAQIRQTSKDITGIVKEIEDIAFQTNLLSLNAAVEAARAGDAGRGFSVVAEEIRKLATKTTDASKITAQLIQKSTKSVEEGSALIDASEQSLKHIVDGARDVASKIEQISQSNIQQANFIIQIRQSIEQISDIVQGNSATSEESAAASEELAAQAQILRELVSRFELLERDGKVL